jgi:hypothetical protein
MPDATKPKGCTTVVRLYAPYVAAHPFDRWFHERPIEVHGPKFGLDRSYRQLGVDPFRQEIRQDLGFYGLPRGERECFAHELHCPLCFLFGVELGADPDLLVGVVAGVERDGLNRLSWFKVASVALRVRRLLGEAFQVDDEGLGLGEGLSVLHAFHVAFICVAVRGSDGDDPVGAWHLELEVCVVRDGHELGVARSPQHRVVCSSEPDHLEREGFPVEVGGSSEADGQIELSKGQDALSGDDPVKRRRTGPDRGQIDPKEPEGLGVDDVEAAASVHEDLVEPGVADDGVDNEWVPSWARHAVGVVALVEGDGLVGPV